MVILVAATASEKPIRRITADLNAFVQAAHDHHDFAAGIVVKMLDLVGYI